MQQRGTRQKEKYYKNRPSFSSSCFPKGQSLSGDFIISIAVFLFVLAIVLPLFGQISERTRADSEQRELETRSVFVSDAVTKTSGYPADWNATSVKTLGLSDDGVLNITKLRNFIGMSYSSARDAMTVADLDFNVSFQDINGYALFSGVSQNPAAYFYVSNNVVQQYLDSQPVVWDLYYGGAGQPNSGNSRNRYSGTPAGAFNAMAGNQSLYKTIIIEETQLTQSQVNIQGLKNFVSSGGTLVFIGGADLISSGFSMSSGTTSGNGVVAKQNNFIDANASDVVSFNNTRWYFYKAAGDAQLDVFVASNLDPAHALIGKWNHGTGLIYFITDISGTVGGSQLSPLLNIVGKKLEQGAALSQTATVSATQRSAILRSDRDRFVKMTLLLWK